MGLKGFYFTFGIGQTKKLGDTNLLHTGEGVNSSARCSLLTWSGATAEATHRG